MQTIRWYKSITRTPLTPVIPQMSHEVDQPRVSFLLLVILCIHIAVSLPGKFIPVNPTPERPPSLADLSPDVLDKLEKFKEMLARRGARQPKVQLTPENTESLKTSDTGSTTDLVGSDETVKKIQKKKKKMRKEWKKFKKWRRKKRRKKKMRNRIIQMITSKLEGKLQEAGGKLNEKNLKRIFDID